MSILDSLGIELVCATPTLTVQRWVVTDQLTQPYGALHGGICAAIAEQAASIGADLAVKADPSIDSSAHAVGMSIESHHLAPVFSGTECETRAVPEKLGGKIQVWRVEQRIIETNEIFNVSTVTMYTVRSSKQS